MTERLGIIPAAGKALRFGGVLKEMLPLREGYAMIDRAHEAMGLCDNVLIITSALKIAAIVEHLPCCTYRIQLQRSDLWGAILESFDLAGKRNYFAMPDTLFPVDAFGREFPADFTLGLFKTDRAERFGMLRGNAIVDKQPGEAGRAWGVLVWSAAVVDFWKANLAEIPNFTQAINLAMTHFGFAAFNLDYYYDNSDMPAYREILSHV